MRTRTTPRYSRGIRYNRSSISGGGSETVVVREGNVGTGRLHVFVRLEHTHSGKVTLEAGRLNFLDPGVSLSNMKRHREDLRNGEKAARLMFDYLRERAAKIRATAARRKKRS